MLAVYTAPKCKQDSKLTLVTTSYISTCRALCEGIHLQHCDTFALPHLRTQLSTTLPQLWDLPAGALMTCAAAQGTEAARKWTPWSPRQSPFLKTLSFSRNMAYIFSTAGCYIFAPRYFSSITNISYKHQLFCSIKAWTPTMLARPWHKVGRQKHPWWAPRNLGRSFPQGHDYHRYQHCVQAAKSHTRSTHMASSNTVPKPLVLHP